MEKDIINQFIESIATDLTEMADFIFDHPETGNQEYEACALVSNYFKCNGFETERSVGGLETSFRAVYRNGSGGPSIGFLCEYDALPELNHACGHHAQAPTIAGAAVALKNKLKNYPFQIVVYGTPAEETTSGKLTMLENGCFKDIDVAFTMHLDTKTCVDVRSMAMTEFEVTFHGETAHAAIKPESGKSALDAMLLSFQGLEFLREHVTDDVRIHYTVVDAGGPANVVPPKAVGNYYVRSYNRVYLDDVIRRFKNIMNGAALMTDTTVEIHIKKELNNKIPVLSLNKILMDNAAYVNAPSISPPREKTGSNDFSNVMYTIPGACIRIAFLPCESAAPHSKAFFNAGKSESAHKAIIKAAQILASTAYDLITSADLFSQVRNEFRSNKEKANIL